MCFDVPLWWCAIADLIILASLIGSVLLCGICIRAARVLVIHVVRLLIAWLRQSAQDQ
jgi:hypothetical protein